MNCFWKNKKVIRFYFKISKFKWVNILSNESDLICFMFELSTIVFQTSLALNYFEFLQSFKAEPSIFVNVSTSVCLSQQYFQVLLVIKHKKILLNFQLSRNVPIKIKTIITFIKNMLLENYYYISLYYPIYSLDLIL